MKKAKVNFAEAVALDAYIKLMRASEAVTTRAHVVLPAGMTTTQFGVLEALHHSGPMSPTAIASKLLKSGGNITLVLDNLERAKLVNRERDAKDRRQILVSLTPLGQERIATLFPALAASMGREFSVLSNSEQLELARLCRKLGLGHPTAAGTITTEQPAQRITAPQTNPPTIS